MFSIGNTDKDISISVLIAENLYFTKHRLPVIYQLWMVVVNLSNGRRGRIQWMHLVKLYNKMYQYVTPSITHTVLINVHRVKCCTKCVNSSPCSAAYIHIHIYIYIYNIYIYMRQRIRSAMVQIMVCRLFGAKPLSKSMLRCCQLDS